MFVAKTLRFYKQKHIGSLITSQAENKEISVRFDSYFGKRPEALFNEGDVLEFAKKKATSFHCSEELWSNPLLIKTGMGKKEIADLRIGWDLILDIDCPYWPLSKLITHLFILSLQAHGISSTTVKFSGNKGFHIAVPFEAFPERFQGQETKDLFPEAPKRIAYYLLDYLVRNYVRNEGDHLIFADKYKINKEKLVETVGNFMETRFICQTCENESTESTCSSCGGQTKEANPVFNPLRVIEVDTILLAHRHLYRMPYSFHEKSQLISVPIHTEKVLSFSKKQANPNTADLSAPFLERNIPKGEATKLLIAAYDFEPQLSEKVTLKKEYEIPATAIPEKFFPPCIKGMLNGMKDGKKRTLFTLINFLRGCGWDHDQIEELLYAWNKRNEEPLREVVLKGQLRYTKIRNEVVPPHNCKRYYQDMGVCRPDNFCAKIKNPLQYARLKSQREKKRPKLTEEQKEMRRKYRESKKSD